MAASRRSVLERVGIESGLLAFPGTLDLEVGFFILGLFILTWLIALAVWRLGRIEERWSAASSSSPDSAGQPRSSRMLHSCSGGPA